MYRILNLLVALLLFVTCTSCNKKKDGYTKEAWLYDLALRSGIISSRNTSNDEMIEGLLSWGVIKDKSQVNNKDNLNYEFLAYSLSNLLGENNVDIKLSFDSEYEDEINNFLSYGLIDINEFKVKDELSYFKANEILKKAVNIINSKEFDSVYDIELSNNVYKVEDTLYDGQIKLTNDFHIGDIIYNDDKYYVVEEKSDIYHIIKEIELEDVIDKAFISDSFELNFDKAYIEDYYNSYHEESSYQNDVFKRTANLNHSKTFKVNGFDISYSINSNKIHLHISKKTKRGINVYYDGDIYNIRPSYKWKYSKGIIEDAYFRVDFKSNNEVGMSVGKYSTLYGDFNKTDNQTLFNTLKNFLKDKEDIIDTSFTICKIHLPIPELPLVEFTVELKVNVYVSGEVEIVMDGVYNTGLEIKNNQLRIIFDKKMDIDNNIKASTNATTSLTFALAALNKDLINFRTNFGAKAHALATIHLYDDNGIKTTEKTNQDYDVIEEYQNHDKVFVCGDLSLSWILNLDINTSNSLAYNFGLNKKMIILDENDQIFKNKHHIENGHFVDHCTRNMKVNNESSDGLININPNRITLDNYSLVMKKDTLSITIKSLPNGYGLNDLNYESSNPLVVSVDSKGQLKRIKPGVSKIRISTKDSKYEIFLNVLVSDETLSSIHM